MARDPKALVVPATALCVLAAGLIYWKISIPASAPETADTATLSIKGPELRSSNRPSPSASLENSSLRPDQARMDPAPAPPPEAATAYPDESSEAAAASRAAKSTLLRENQELMKQMAAANPEERRRLMEKMRENHAKARAGNAPQAAAAGAESNRPEMHFPPAPRIPEDASPELRELITARHALMKERADLMNQLRDASPEERQKAMRKWHEANANRLRAMHTAALPSPSPRSPAE